MWNGENINMILYVCIGYYDYSNGCQLLLITKFEQEANEFKRKFNEPDWSKYPEVRDKISETVFCEIFKYILGVELE